MPQDPESRLDELLVHRTYVRALARQLVFDSSLAKDVEQDTWLAALEQAPRDPSAQRGWLAAVVRNLARKAWRSSGRLQAREREHARLERHVPTPGEVLEREELHRRLVEAVNALEGPYREALVLRYLEGCEPKEVARRLGLPLESARTRLKRGLALLRARLDRDQNGNRGAWCLCFVKGFGLGPPSLWKLAGVALSAPLTGPSGTLSMAIVKKTVLASAVLAVASSLFLVALDAESSTSQSRGGDSMPAEAAAELAAQAAAEPAQSAQRVVVSRAGARASAEGSAAVDPSDLVSLEGRVLDPDGKPLAGALVIVTRWYLDERHPPGPLAATKSDARGHFVLAYEKSDERLRVDVERPEMWRHVTVAAFAAGHGPGWCELDQRAEGEPLELRLARDEALSGRLIDLEGRPAAGVRVRALILGATDSGSLDRFLEDPVGGEPSTFLGLPPEQELATETDDDGRFALHGLGAERLVHLDLRGERIARAGLEVVTRVLPADWPGKARRPLLGSGFQYVVRPTRPIVGVVRDAATGAPLAGVTVASEIMAGSMMMDDSVRTLSDAEGRFRLLGMPKGEGNQIVAIPGEDQPYFIQDLELPDSAGMAPIEVELELVRGLWITGSVRDASGAPLYGRLHYLPYLDNPEARKAFGSRASNYLPGAAIAQHHYRTDVQGRFRLVGLPGPAIVGVQTIGRHRQGIGALEIAGFDEEGEFATFANPIAASTGWPTAMRKIDPASGTESVTCDLVVDEGGTLAIGLKDPEGRPLEHCSVRGSSNLTSFAQASDAGPTVTIETLGPGERRLLRIHQDELCLGLATHVTLEQGPRELVLVPCTTIVARLVDEAGAPVPDVSVACQTSLPNDSGPSTLSDAGGGVRIEHVVPGIPFRLVASSPALQDLQQAIEVELELRGGTIDLGEVVVRLR